MFLIDENYELHYYNKENDKIKKWDTNCLSKYVTTYHGPTMIDIYGNLWNDDIDFDTDVVFKMSTSTSMGKVFLDVDGYLWTTRLPSESELVKISDRKFYYIDGYHGLTCAIDFNYDIWILKFNWGTTEIIYKKLPADAKFEQISVSGGLHLFALDLDGNIWSYGNNKFGQLGRTDGNNGVLTKIPINQKFRYVSCHNNSSFAIDLHGYVWSCGYNGTRELGTNRGSTNQLTKINSDQQFKMIHSSSGTTYMLDVEGYLWMCGGEYKLPLTKNTYGKFLSIENQIIDESSTNTKSARNI